MAKFSNVFSQGSGGSSFEAEVQTCFFISFILGLNIPVAQGNISSFRQQSSSLGYYTDDLYLECVFNTEVSRILIQIKHNLVVSANGKEFIEVINNAWIDFRNKDLFNKELDKLFVIKSDLTLDEKKHLNVLLDWARSKNSTSDFISEANRIKSKKKYLDIFRDILLAKEPELSDEHLHDFLKVLYFIEMDLGTDVSHQRASFYTFINNYKVDDRLTASEIWSVIYEIISTGNSKGSQYDLTNIPKEIISYFNQLSISQDIKSILKLSKSNYELIEFIEDEIGDYNLQRTELMYTCASTLIDNRILLITGKPGSGKSALAKSQIHKLAKTNEGLVLCFKADELGQGDLREYFAKKDIHISLKEIFSHFSMSNDNLIYIDALEKLLETSGNAFSQLIALVKQLPMVKIIITCREANLALLDLKYLNSLSYVKLTVNNLNVEELKEVADNVPSLKYLIDNNRLKSLISIPKYLDFAFRALKSQGKLAEDIDEEGFKEVLWEVIVENKINEFQQGLPERRSNVFLDIAVNRATSMKPFVNIKADDAEALEKLVKDNVIVKSLRGNFYAPAHDVLEDWALIKHVNNLYIGTKSNMDFFESLGVNPAIRRAYRLWVHSALSIKDEQKISFITKELFETSKRTYWLDECLIAILQSDYCEVFFERHNEQLIEDNFRLFWHIVEIIRMACRENIGNMYQKLYIPVGKGWDLVISFFKNNIETIPTNKYGLIFNVIQEWSKVVSVQDELPSSTRNAGLIVLHLLKGYYKPSYSNDGEVDLIVRVLCLLVGGISNELKSILEKEDMSEDEEEWDDEKLNKKILKVVLSGNGSEQFAKYLPELTIKLANDHWLFKSCVVHYPKDAHEQMMFSISRSSRNSRYGVDEDFGLKDDLRSSNFPASGLQTPTRFLLKYHTDLAVGFIVDLMNWSSENYFLSEFSNDDNCSKIKLTLTNGKTVEQLSSNPLWQIYRGSQKVTPYFLQSVLMSLENYLLDLCKGGMVNKEKLDKIVEYLFEYSNNVSTTAVVASIYQAYPEFAAPHLVTLYSSRKLLSLDLQRYIGDRTKSNFGSFEPEHDQERRMSNDLPHRKIFHGLRGFINTYCFNYGEANAELFKLIDRHRQNADKSDFEWLKILDEIDNRTWKITEKIDDGENIKLVVQPTYQEEIQEFVSLRNEEISRKSLDDESSNWLMRVMKTAFPNEFDSWRRFHKYYLSLEQFNWLNHMPGLLSVIGLRDYQQYLNDDERNWCLSSIHKVFEAKVKRFYNRFNMDITASVFDNDYVMKFYPKLASNSLILDKTEYYTNILYFATSPFQDNDPDANDFLYSIRDLWHENEEFAYKVLTAIIEVSKFSMTHSFFREQEKGSKFVKKYWKSYEKIISDVLKSEIKLSEEEFSHEKYNIAYLGRAIKILPDSSDNPKVFIFLVRILKFYVLESLKESERRRNKQDIGELRFTLQQKISTLIFWSDNELSKEFLAILLSKSIEVVKVLLDANTTKLLEIFGFFKDVIEGIIIIADNNLPKDDEEVLNTTVTKFYSCWTSFRNYLLENKTYLFSNYLFLDIKWNQEATHWKPLDGNSKFFLDLVPVFGNYQLQAIINLASFIGDQSLLVGLLKWIVPKIKELQQKDMKLVSSLDNLEQLVLRAYNNHLDELVIDNIFHQNYLELLDIMIENGSSDAYWIREFLISFSAARLDA